MKEYKKADSILKKYRLAKQKVLMSFSLRSNIYQRYSSIDVDAKDLCFCERINFILKKMMFVNSLYGSIIKNKYIVNPLVSNTKQAKIMRVSKSTFYRILRRALLMFIRLLSR